MRRDTTENTDKHTYDNENIVADGNNLNKANQRKHEADDESRVVETKPKRKPPIL